MTFSAESFVYFSLFVCVLFEKRLDRSSSARLCKRLGCLNGAQLAVRENELTEALHRVLTCVKTRDFPTFDWCVGRIAWSTFHR